ncbi:hypothetical protein [Streptomyces sp. NPDC051662]|uniref:hypothetical protein n=1 Tax=Streptomyces sp. NPDC051662 TaxID=3154750 RepID=UPI003438D24C
MRVVPWMYDHSKGEGYQLILSGHVQQNIIWRYGAEEIVVQRAEGAEPFRDVKSVAVPSDYRGKPWRDVADGMRDHMRVIASGLTRANEGDCGMSEFREEWAMHRFRKGQKVSFQSVRGGSVLGVVKGVERRGTERVVLIRVTSRKNPLWNLGDIIDVNPTSPWLKSREV